MKNRISRHVPVTLLALCALGVPAAYGRADGRSAAHRRPQQHDLRRAGHHRRQRGQPGVRRQPHLRRHQQRGEPVARPDPDERARRRRGAGQLHVGGDLVPSFEDYSVDRVGPDAATSSEFWGQLVNSKFSSVGGCQERINTGDEVLWAFDAFSKTQAAGSPGPTSHDRGKPFTVAVTNGGHRRAARGPQRSAARVTGADGKAALTFDQAGIYRLKATAPDSVRSNALNVCVDPAGAAPCTSTDKAAPKLKLPSLAGDHARQRARALPHDPLRLAGRRLRRERRDGLLGRRGRGAGVAGVRERRRVPAARGPHRAHARVLPRQGRPLVPVPRDRVRPGDEQGALESGVISIPVDDRDDVLKLSRGWKRLRRKQRLGRTVIRSRLKGAGALLRFSGRRIALIGRKLPQGRPAAGERGRQDARGLGPRQAEVQDGALEVAPAGPRRAHAEPAGRRQQPGGARRGGAAAVRRSEHPDRDRRGGLRGRPGARAPRRRRRWSSTSWRSRTAR